MSLNTMCWWQAISIHVEELLATNEEEAAPGSLANSLVQKGSQDQLFGEFGGKIVDIFSWRCKPGGVS